MTAVRTSKKWDRYYAAAVLVANVVPIPVVAGLIAVALAFLNVIPGGPGSAIGSGILIAIVAWLLIALPCRYFATSAHADPGSGDSAKRKFYVLKKRLDIVRHYHQTQLTPIPLAPQADQTLSPRHPSSTEEAIALGDAQTDLSTIEFMLQDEGMQWVLSTGYLNVWSRLHAAEEAMVNILPKQTVIDDAKYDQLCLVGSEIDDREGKLALLTRAIKTLSAPKTTEAKPASPNQQDSDLQSNMAQAMLALFKHTIDPPTHGQPVSSDQDTNVKERMAQAMLALVKSGMAVSCPTEEQSPQQSEAEARSDLRQIRCALNKFNDERWAKLVQYRKILMGTTLITEFLTFILLYIALLAGGNSNLPTIIAATGFYLVGAAVGLISRLYSEWRGSDPDIKVDDYGLTMYRILVTPLLSGLAALGGVLVVAILSLSLAGAGSQPVPSVNPPSTPTVVSTVTTTSAGTTVQVTITQQPPAQPPLTLQRIYSFSDNNLGAVVFAAVFGLVPSLFINLLQQQANNVKKEIQGASPGDQGESKKENASKSIPTGSNNGTTSQTNSSSV